MSRAAQKDKEKSNTGEKREAIPFDEALRRLVTAPPQRKPANKPKKGKHP
jgi:hypothetical protein